jgi:serine/threonine protein kinase
MTPFNATTTTKTTNNAKSRNVLLVKYKISDALYGPVFCCQLQNHQKLFAVKQVDLKQAMQYVLTTGKTHDNPWQEYRVASILIRTKGHANVLTFYPSIVSEEDQKLHLLMEFCEGGDLFEYVSKQQNQRLQESHALQVFTQILHGVEFLHTNGIAHRDLSLENILHDTHTGQWKIADFGLSTDTTTKCHDRVGKAYYMAPEVVRQEQYDPMAADVWSLGIILFILLTGSPMVPLASEEEIAFRVVKTYGVSCLLSIWKLRSSFSMGTIDLLESMLDVSPLRRPSIHSLCQHPMVLHSLLLVHNTKQ